MQVGQTVSQVARRDSERAGKWRARLTGQNLAARREVYVYRSYAVPPTHVLRGSDATYEWE